MGAPLRPLTNKVWVDKGDLQHFSNVAFTISQKKLVDTSLAGSSVAKNLGPVVKTL